MMDSTHTVRIGGSASQRGAAAFSRRELLLWSMLAAGTLLAGCASRPAVHSNASHSPAQSGRTGIEGVSLGLDSQLREPLYARLMMVVNTPYTYGGNTPEGGFDCSGLVLYAMRGITNRKLPRTTAQWATVSALIDPGRLQRGDFVFFNTLGGRYSHMGIYAGNDQFVHAPSSGGIVKRVPMGNPYFTRRFTEARTVFA